jgi:hypothetical protein
VQKQEVKSKAVNWVRYDDVTKSLEVEFASSSLYRYFDVPRDVYEWLLKVESKGKFVNRLVKEKYRYERLEPSEPRSEDIEELLRNSLTKPPKT